MYDASEGQMAYIAAIKAIAEDRFKGNWDFRRVICQHEEKALNVKDDIDDVKE